MPVELEVKRLRELVRNRQFAQCLEGAQALSREVPENRDVLFLVAFSQRFLGRIMDALSTLDVLERHHPRFSRLYQERGHCYVVLKNAPKAIDAFLTAVNINPALPASWGLLEGLYRMTGDAANSATAASHVATLKNLAPAVVEATSLFSDGDLAESEAIIRAHLLKHGQDVEAMRLLARIGLARDVLDDAELLLEAVLTLAPDYQAARHNYAQVLLARHKHLPARRELETLLKKDPENRLYLVDYATTLVGLGEHDKAAPLYRRLLVDSPRAADLHLSLAHCLKTLGQTAEAIDSYRASAAARPAYGDAYWSLANLKTYRFTEEEIERMQVQEASPTTSLVDRYHLSFALGKAFEDREDYAKSYRFYEQGNALKKSESDYRPETIERNTRLQIEVCNADFMASRRGTGADSDEPIFIVGLPRAGSTLLEQILASHSKVEGTQELADIPRMVFDLQGRGSNPDDPRYPGVLADLQPEDFLRLGKQYLRDTAIYRRDADGRGGRRPHFIDKMPNNFRHVGLIHLILPNARIIDARREPMACCFSNLKQLFANGQEFTYGVGDIARYYRTYLELMRHWDRVLPGRILRIQHEDVVDDLEGNVRRILEFCGLEFEPGCVEFYKMARSVRTASSEQVRQPIFREGLEQWKHFEPWLGPLREALGDAVDHYRS
jgi:tetratricopeptide (TPR) repeat protein